MILILKNVEHEGPGSLEEFLVSRKWQTKIVELYNQSSSRSEKSESEELTEHVHDSDIDAVVVMGGPMNVYQDAEYPFLIGEQLFLRKAIQAHIPIVGICLGAQLLAKILGAQIIASPSREIGWYTVNLKQEAKVDPLFKGLGNELDVFQWHEDMFCLPSHATLLATSQQCPFQAFRYNNFVYGIQFHIEITDKEIMRMTKSGRKRDGMLKDYFLGKEKFNAQAQIIYQNFEQIILNRKRNKKNICI